MPVYNIDAGTVEMNIGLWEEKRDKAARLDRWEAENGYAMPACEMETWDRAKLEQEFTTASESLGWCEFYMKEWERGCDADKAAIMKSHNRLAVAVSVLSGIVGVTVLTLLGLAIGAWR